MKYGSKNIALINAKGEVIHSRYRYKHLRTAMRRAVAVSYEERKFVQVWHLDRGICLAEVSPPPFAVRSKLFHTLWNAA